MKLNRKLLLFVSVICLLLIFVAVLYIDQNTYYTDLNIVKRVNITTFDYAFLETKGNNIYIPSKNNLKGIIVYPGGLVDPLSYSLLCAEMAKTGYTCVIVSMPFNLAIFGINKAFEIMEEFKYIKSWAIVGHSLGGSIGCRFVENYSFAIDSLFLLGAYCDVDISKLSTKVISIFGSEDKILNINLYNIFKKNLPSNFVERILEGGNHSFFGTYGLQKGDGNAILSNEDQIFQTVKIINQYY